MASGRYHRSATQAGHHAGGSVAQGRIKLIDAGQRAVAPVAEGEWLIAEAIGVHPSEIWPSRYYDPHSDCLLDRKARIKS